MRREFWINPIPDDHDVTGSTPKEWKYFTAADRSAWDNEIHATELHPGERIISRDELREALTTIAYYYSECMKASDKDHIEEQINELFDKKLEGE
jgi:hypothetical protein